MRTPMLALLLVAGLSACATPDRSASIARVPLRGADCLDPSSARSWHDVSSTEVIVDSGRRRYRLTLAHQCSLLGNDPALVFVGDPISGRICGNAGDAIVVDRGERCRIDRIELIDPSEENPARSTPEAAESGSR